MMLPWHARSSVSLNNHYPQVKAAIAGLERVPPRTSSDAKEMGAAATNRGLAMMTFIGFP
eukprot:6002425-Pyramimonas_sp.AAC.1